MAINRLEVKTGSKGKGASALAKAKYILREGNRPAGEDKLTASGSLNMPEWVAGDTKKYWEMTDLHERENAILYREIDPSLPIELTFAQQMALVEEFAARVSNATGGKLPLSWGMHSGRGTNPHAHIILSERINDGVDRPPEQWFKRPASAYRHSKTKELTQPTAEQIGKGGSRKADISSDRKVWLAHTRKLWEELANEHLTLAGHSVRIDMRSNKDRGNLEAEPQLKLGQKVIASHNKGIKTQIVARVIEDHMRLCKIYRLAFTGKTGNRIEYTGAVDRGDYVTVTGKASAAKGDAAVQAFMDKGWVKVKLFGNREHQIELAKACFRKGIEVVADADVLKEARKEYEQSRSTFQTGVGRIGKQVCADRGIAPDVHNDASTSDRTGENECAYADKEIGGEGEGLGASHALVETLVEVSKWSHQQNDINCVSLQRTIHPESQ